MVSELEGDQRGLCLLGLELEAWSLMPRWGQVLGWEHSLAVLQAGAPVCLGLRSLSPFGTSPITY